MIIFGSYAKGKATIKSDLDICVIKETELPISSRAQELGPMLLQGLIRLDVHIYTPEEVEVYGKEPFSFVNSILRTGKRLFCDTKNEPLKVSEERYVVRGTNS